MRSLLPCLLTALTVGACSYAPLPALILDAAETPDSVPDAGEPLPEGPHYQFVAKQLFVPTSNVQARDYGFDLNGDGGIDNQFGMVLSTLGGMGFEIQSTIDTAVAEGSIIHLVDFQTNDFSNTPAAGIQTSRGANPIPPACNTGETYDTTTKTGCSHHLQGTGSFTIAASSPSNAALVGSIVDGTFNGGPGDLSLQIAIATPTAINVDLIGARARSSSISASGIGSGLSGGVIFGGAITKDDVDNKLIPAMQGQFAVVVVRDCTDLTNPPGCGCVNDSLGKTILGLFDTTPKDCAVTVEEIKSNSLIVSLLAPDVTVNGKMALSFGMKAIAVPAALR